jgi:hypothetical protein
MTLQVNRAIDNKDGWLAVDLGHWRAATRTHQRQHQRAETVCRPTPPTSELRKAATPNLYTKRAACTRNGGAAARLLTLCATSKRQAEAKWHGQKGADKFEWQFETSCCCG